VTAPGWLDRAEYPFTSKWLELSAGRLHYVDEGQGRPLVFVHGTPDWSFLWRQLIKALAPGFGLSARPHGSWYRPENQAANLRTLIERLELRDVTLVLHDFGGPFGLSYALERPDNVRSLVLMNTWMWSLRGDRHFEWAGRFFASRLGRFLYLRHNFAARVLLKYSFADRARLPSRIHAQYLGPFPTPESRTATWAYARSLLDGSEWYESLWRRRERLRDKPTLIVWGTKDRAFREKELTRLETVFARREVIRLDQVGHFPPEEAPEAVSMLVRGFLERE
jgi:pimeloyl-ACP methyl ester carboxylesterase